MTDTPSRLDRMIAAISPSLDAKRQEARLQADAIKRRRQLLARYQDAEGHRLNRARILTPYGTADWQTNQMPLDLWTLREASRDLARENPLARGILQTAVDNAVGSGFALQVQSADLEWREIAEDYINNRWQCDPRGLMSFVDLQRLVYESVLRDGDILIIPADGQLYPVEADRLNLSFGATPLGEGNHIVQSVEMDAYGKPQYYWVSSKSWITPVQAECKPYKAEEVIFVSHQQRSSQTRGVPVFAGTIRLFDQLDDYKEAAILAAQMAATYALVIKRANMGGFVMGNADPSDAANPRQQNIQPGEFMYLEPGEDITQVQPQQPGSQFREVMREICRLIGRPLGLPLELTTLDFSESNYSNTRAALLQARRTFEAQQEWFAYAFLRRAYLYAIYWAMKHGELPKPKTNDAYKHQWIGPGFIWVDPLRDTQSDIMQIDNNLTTRAKVASKYSGSDWREIARQRQVEKELDKQLGIVPTQRPQALPIDTLQETKENGE